MARFVRKIRDMTRFCVGTRVFSIFLFLFVVGVATGATTGAWAQLPVPVTDGLGTPPAAAPTPPAATQSQYDTLPIEAALLYSKLLKEEPVYDFFVFTNPRFADSDMSFSRMALMDLERDKLKKLYDDMPADMLIRATVEVEVAGFNPATQTVSLNAFGPHEPIIFDLHDKVKYGVFVRNAADLTTLAPPFEKIDPVGVNIVDARRYMTRVKLTLRPVAADRTDFPLDDGTNVKVILADVVEIKIPSRYNRDIVLHKTFLNYRPAAAGGTATLFSPELLENLGKKKNLQ